MTVQTKVATMNLWVMRRRNKGETATSDEIWARIHHNWPNIPARDKEAIFQGIKV